MNEIDFASETLMHHLQCKTCILVYIALSNAFLSLQKNKKTLQKSYLVWQYVYRSISLCYNYI